MNIEELKVIFSIVIFIMGAVGVLLPWVQSNAQAGDRFMVWGDTFAGGVLAAAGLVHLLSAGASGFQDLSRGFVYPLAFVLAGAGFLLILLIEAVIAAGRDPESSPLHCASKGASHEIGSQIEAAELHPGTLPLILLLVLSVHSIILGMALGAQRSISGALAIFIAIVAHKGMAGFALGVSYRRAGTSLQGTIPGAVIFSSMAPIGILAATAIYATVSSQSRTLFEAIFNSVGAGTFLYIATLDIIRTEFELPGDNWQKWLLATGGFSIMSILAIWI